MRPSRPEGADGRRRSGSRSFPLRPRRPEIPVAIALFGLALVGAALFTRGAARAVDATCGLGLCALVAAYAASPTWRTSLLVDDEGCAVVGPAGERLRIAWRDVSRVLVDDREGACWVDGGAQQRILVPSRGMPTGYVVARHAEATQAIVARVPDRVRHVDGLTPGAPEDDGGAR